MEDGTRGTARNVYLQNDDIKAIQEVAQRYGHTFSGAFRFIRRQWSRYNEIFDDPEQAERVIAGLL
jgi:hypothetical protein